MKLEKFDYQIGNKRKKNTFLILGLVCLGLFITVILYKTFAQYEDVKEYDIIGGKVASFTAASDSLKIYIVNESGNEMSSNVLPLEQEYVYNTERSYCQNGSQIVYNKETNSIDPIENDVCYVYFDYISLAKQSLYALGFDDSDIKTGIPYGPNGTGEIGFYESEDDYGVSYYYYNDASTDWISSPWIGAGGVYGFLIRINGNGTIRILSQEYVGMDAFNSSNDNNMYVGFMFGDSDNPYANINPSDVLYRFTTGYDSSYFEYFGDAIFCNDRSLYDSSYGPKEPDDMATGLGTDTTYYGAYYRIKNDKPSLKCKNKEDAFTVDDEVYGNGLLANPVGLMTADEAYMTNALWFLDFWNESLQTMSPAMFKDGVAYNYATTYDHEFVPVDVNTQYTTFPVFNIKFGYEYEGDGFNDPLVIVE